MGLVGVASSCFSKVYITNEIEEYLIMSHSSEGNLFQSRFIRHCADAHEQETGLFL